MLNISISLQLSVHDFRSEVVKVDLQGYSRLAMRASPRQTHSRHCNRNHTLNDTYEATKDQHTLYRLPSSVDMSCFRAYSVCWASAVNNWELYQLCSWLTITSLQYDRINAFVRTDA